MRIGVSLQSHDETWGGPGVSTREIVRRLVALDQKNEYVLMYPTFGGARRGRGQYAAHPNVVEVTNDGWFPPISELWEQVAVPTLAEQHGVDAFFGPCMAVPIAGRYKKAMIIHGIEYYTVPDAFDMNTALRWEFMEKLVLPAADSVISVSETMTREFHEIVGYPLERMRTIQLGVGEHFRPVTDDAHLADVRRRYGLEEPFLLFVGRLFPSKNLGTLLRALAALGDRVPHRLVVVGRPRWKFAADLSLIGKLGLHDRVRRLDFLPKADLAALYTLADCFVYPSLYESFGLAQLEAMACGCPVVAANTGAIPETTGGAALLVEPRDVEGMAEAIARVVGDRAFRQALVTRGFARAAEFTWDRTAAQVLDIVQELEPPPRRRAG